MPEESHNDSTEEGTTDIFHVEPHSDEEHEETTGNNTTTDDSNKDGERYREKNGSKYATFKDECVTMMEEEPVNLEPVDEENPRNTATKEDATHSTEDSSRDGEDRSEYDSVKVGYSTVRKNTFLWMRCGSLCVTISFVAIIAVLVLTRSDPHNLLPPPVPPAPVPTTFVPIIAAPTTTAITKDAAEDASNNAVIVQGDAPGGGDGGGDGSDQRCC